MLLRFSATLLLLCVSIPYALHAHAQPASWVWPDEWMAHSAFFNTWAVPDAPVAMQAAPRSWLWGPTPFAVVDEPYAEFATALRLVEYFDKGRMEINDPSADRASPWFVSSGLLVTEMVTGQVQKGDSTFEARSPATVLVAGDPGSPEAPTYASFASHTAPSHDLTGQPLSGRIARDGTISPYTPTGDTSSYLSASYDPVSGHNIPAVFSDWMSQPGPILQQGHLTQGQLFDPLYLLGRPITEPYWADVLIDNNPATVLIQLYERRALTYNPANPPEWRVEMANVGRAYYDWRYASAPPPPAIATEIRADKVEISGYNWPPNSSVTMQIGFTIPHGLGPLVGPATISADSAGRFFAPWPLTNDTRLSLNQKVAITIAQSGDYSVSLPLAYGLPSGRTQISGTVVSIEHARPFSSEAILQTLDGAQWSLHLSDADLVRYSEGTEAPMSQLEAGEFVSVDGFARGRYISNPYSFRILSASSSGAHIGYQWSADGQRLMASGSGWPTSQSISLAVSQAITGTAQLIAQPFASLTPDSRGNLSGSVDSPAFDASSWLYAISTGKSGGPVQVALPFQSVSTSSAPQLYITSQSGEQLAFAGSSCWLKACADGPGVPLPSYPIGVSPGETIMLRGRLGPDPDFGPTPLSFSAQLYPYPERQPVLPGTTLNFTPEGQPTFSTGDLPGTPSALALPQHSLQGKYAMQVTVTWPDPTGGTSVATYGLTIQVN